MQQIQLKQTALFITLLGLFILYFYAEIIDLKLTPESINQLPTASKITLEGTITSLQKTDKGTFITIDTKRQETTNIIIFHPESLYLKQGNTIQIQGNVEEYNGKKEIIADKITLLSK